MQAFFCPKTKKTTVYWATDLIKDSLFFTSIKESTAQIVLLCDETTASLFAEQILAALTRPDHLVLDF